MQQDSNYTVTFLVVGGGIAGVSCAEMLAVRCPEESTLLLTESSVIKTVANIEPVARYLHKFDVRERSALAANANASDGSGNGLAPCITVIVDKLEGIVSHENYVMTQLKKKIHYKYLCICTGGRPRIIAEQNSRVLGIRDTDSVIELQKRLKNASCIVLVGNGGIASELVFELKDVTVHWVIKDNHISSTFVDPGAALFLLKCRNAPTPNEGNEELTIPTTSVVKRMRYEELVSDNNKSAAAAVSEHKAGPALGPDWHRSFQLIGAKSNENQKNLQSEPIIHYNTEIQNFKNLYDDSEGKLTVTLTNGETIECDFIVSATGVNPNHSYTCDQEFKIASDGGVEVNELMQTNIENIYAAGDVCTASWTLAEHWFQMRLWTQARQMGAMAASSMAAALKGETIFQDFSFEIFGHVTQLFGMSVILLGRFNGQGLGTDYEILLRTTPNKEYIKFVIQRGRLRGAILIGNTELAETCENLILNAIDLTPFGDDILNPDIDIEDYFD